MVGNVPAGFLLVRKSFSDGICVLCRTFMMFLRSLERRLLLMALIVSAAVIFCDRSAFADNATTAGVVYASSIEESSILVSMPYTGDDNHNSAFTIRWKLCADSSYPSENTISSGNASSPFTTTINGLAANTCYSIEATYDDPDAVAGKNPQVIRITSSWDDTLLHNVNRFRNTPVKWSSYGGWGLPDTRYGRFVCRTCHKPAVSNIKRVKSDVTAPSGTFPGSAVNFRSTWNTPYGFGDDGNWHTTSTKICEVCHSVTSHHRYDTRGQSDSRSHFNNTDCIQCHPHSVGFFYEGIWGSIITDCISCHKTAMGSRRQIVDSNGNGTGTGGDFKKASHHYYSSIGAISSADCRVCHDTSQHTGGAVRLKDADSGAIYVYDPSNPSTAEDFCLSCHDENGANGNMRPFSDWKTLGVVPYKAGKEIKANWNKTYGHKQKGLTCLGNGSPDTGCHSNGHGSDYKGLLASNLTLPNMNGNSFATGNEPGYALCFSCHSSYPNVTKEAIFGVKQSGNYDEGGMPYYIPAIMTKFRDKNGQGSGNFYDDPSYFTYMSNLHYFHVQLSGSWKYRGSVTSSVICLSCHSVHGSNSPFGWVYDEMRYDHYSGAGSDAYGMMNLQNFNTLNSHPVNCVNNCHTIQGNTYNWFEPAGE